MGRAQNCMNSCWSQISLKTEPCAAFRSLIGLSSPLSFSGSPMLKIVVELGPFFSNACGLCRTPFTDFGSSGSASVFITRKDDCFGTTTPVYGRNSHSLAMMSSPLNSAWNFSSLMPITATTAFFRLPSFPTCTSRRSRFSPLASLFSFLTQNFGLGNFEKRNSFGAGGFPENDTFPSTVPPAHDVIGAARSAIAPIAIADITPTFFMTQSSLLEFGVPWQNVCSPLLKNLLRKEHCLYTRH